MRSSGSGTGSTQPPEYNWPHLWSSGQSSWLQIQRSGFYSRRYKISWEVVGLERGPLSLMSTIDRLCGLVVCGLVVCGLVVCGLEFLATDPELRVRLPALPNFLRSSGSGTGSTRPREYNWPPLWSWIDTTSNRNEYHGTSWRYVKTGA
jgi:hypothetical protein